MPDDREIPGSPAEWLAYAGLERLGMDVPEAVWEAADLTRFAWEARYPSFGEPVSREEYEQALAERVAEWATTLVEGRAS